MAPFSKRIWLRSGADSVSTFGSFLSFPAEDGLLHRLSILVGIGGVVNRMRGCILFFSARILFCCLRAVVFFSLFQCAFSLPSSLAGLHVPLSHVAVSGFPTDIAALFLVLGSVSCASNGSVEVRRMVSKCIVRLRFSTLRSSMFTDK